MAGQPWQPREKLDVVLRFTAPQACNGSAAQKGWRFNGSKSTPGLVTYTGAATQGKALCLDAASSGGVARLLPCDPSREGQQRQLYTWSQTASALMNRNSNCMGTEKGQSIPGVPAPNISAVIDVEGCNGLNTAAFAFTGAGELRVNGSTCVTAAAEAPSVREQTLHVFKKPQPGGVVAVLHINDWHANVSGVSLQLGSVLPPSAGGKWKVRDAVQRKDVKTVLADAAFELGTLQAYGSRFLLLSKAAEPTVKPTMRPLEMLRSLRCTSSCWPAPSRWVGAST